jgi:hypothetical protein
MAGRSIWVFCIRSVGMGLQVEREREYVRTAVRAWELMTEKLTRE